MKKRVFCHSESEPFGFAQGKLREDEESYQDGFFVPFSAEFRMTLSGCLVILFSVLFFISSVCYADQSSGKTDLSGGIFDYICKMRDEFGVKVDGVFGEDSRVFAGGSPSDETYSMKLCAEQRKFLEENMTLGVDVRESILDDKRYRQDTLTGSFYLYSRMDRYTKFSTELKYTETEIYHLSDSLDTAVSRYKGNNRIAALFFRCENEPVDDEDYPKTGRKTDLRLEVSLKGLGSDFNFLRAGIDNAFYYTPAKWIFKEGPLAGITFVLNGQCGWVKEFGSDQEVPFFERVYAGGTGTVRGYKSRYLSPKDAEGLPLGGGCMLVFNAEMRYPLYKDIKGALFYDQGNAWEKTRDIDLSDTKAGIGTGLRWVTSLGAARLDYGYGLNSSARQRGGRVHLSLGMKF